MMEYEATKIYEEELKQQEKPGGIGMKIIKKEDVELGLNKLVEILKDLKFNKYRGEFLKYDISHRIFDVFKCSNIDIIEGEECAVCYERTLTKTKCNHSICYRCMEQIQTIPDPDYPGSYHEHYKPCPMCRKDITYLT